MSDKYKEAIKKYLNYNLMIGFHEGFKETDFGKIVFTGPTTLGDSIQRIGRVEQVRKKAGAFGSDLVFLRHPDGTLSTHENQGYISIADKDLEEVKKLFIPEALEVEYDPEEEYTIGKSVWPEKGFIVPFNGKISGTDISFSMIISQNKEVAK